MCPSPQECCITSPTKALLSLLTSPREALHVSLTPNPSATLSLLTCPTKGAACLSCQSCVLRSCPTPLLHPSHSFPALQEALHVSLARAVLQSPDRAVLMASVAPLHPVQLSDIPPSGLQRARRHYQGEVQRLLQLAGGAKEATAGADTEPGAGAGPGPGAGTEPRPGAGAADGMDGAGPGAAEVTAGAVSADGILRLILAVQCNAFYSGFYLQCSMFNHW